ncbi:LCP family protein [Actinomadura sp. SCN-SB]|uniref:LCP family protein n=1 Tax=Actinomadura sp. SCN-SB TaxID=3373092 RepID=UPI003751F22F
MGGPSSRGRLRGGSWSRRGRGLRLLTGFMIAGVTTALAVVALVSWRTGTYDRNIQRLPDALPTGSRERPAEDAGQNWLLVGSDLRGAPAADKWRPGGGARADTIMLLHMPEEGGRAYVISFPRDLWVDIPGGDEGKINSAFAKGGSRLLAETVESISGVRVDHVAALDFTGFKTMTDALGGVDIHLDRPIHDPSNGWSWPAGRNHLDGEEALRFVRERKGLSGSDLDRVRRQHAFLKALADKAADSGLMTNPWRLDAFLRAASGSLAVDSETEFGTLRTLALRLARIGPGRVTFVTLPTGASAWIDDQNVLLPDEEGTDGLFDALLDGDLEDHLDEHDLETDLDLEG